MHCEHWFATRCVETDGQSVSSILCFLTRKRREIVYFVRHLTGVWPIVTVRMLVTEFAPQWTFCLWRERSTKRRGFVNHLKPNNEIIGCKSWQTRPRIAFVRLTKHDGATRIQLLNDIKYSIANSLAVRRFAYNERRPVLRPYGQTSVQWTELDDFLAAALSLKFTNRFMVGYIIHRHKPNEHVMADSQQAHTYLHTYMHAH